MPDLHRLISDANRAFWDQDAARYHAEHPEYLADFYWCPEMLSEEDARLLGELDGKRVVEIGCGSASCTRWVSGRAELAVGCDISEAMLRRAAPNEDGNPLPLVQADALRLPFKDGSFDIAFSAFGAFPFIADLDAALAEVSRVIIPGGRFVFSVNHPMRWIFPDDPESLTAEVSYFDRAYMEHDDEGRISYAEFHRTMGDWIRALQVRGNFIIDNLIEPEWPADLERTWGQWSPKRGEVFPGTAIFCCTRRSNETKRLL